MTHDLWPAVIIGAATLCVVDMVCYFWLRSNSSRFERQLAYLERDANFRPRTNGRRPFVPRLREASVAPFAGQDEQFCTVSTKTRA